jgi:uncharacterized protein
MQSLFRYIVKFSFGIVILLVVGTGGIVIAGESGDLKGVKFKDGAVKAALLPVRLYQGYLSPVLGGRCPMYPSCSHYAVDAIEKHGAVTGWFMACDRLMRCGRDEVRLAPVVHINHSPHTFDTVAENDFWLK